MDQDKRNPEEATLQELQGRFDASRGFDDLPFESGYLRSAEGAGSPRNQGENLLRQLEYVTAAAAGEAGELLGVIKKWRTSIAMGRSISPPLQDLCGELADTYIYLLKMANILGRDLDQIYLEKAVHNILRFPHKPEGAGDARVISVIGPPGAGKTTAVDLLSHHLGANTGIYKRTSNNLTGGSKQSAWDARQAGFLEEYRSFLSAEKASQLVLDQDPSADVLVYSGQFFEDGQLSDVAYADLLRRLLAFEGEFETRCRRRLLIHLHADPSVLVDRSRQKNDVNSAFNQEWIGRVAARFKKVYEGTNVAKCIDTTHLSKIEVGDTVLSICRSYFQDHANGMATE